MKPNIYECKACKKKIVYLRTSNGNSMPVDYKEDIVEGELFDRLKHTTHFATCPNANHFRKKNVSSK